MTEETWKTLSLAEGFRKTNQEELEQVKDFIKSHFKDDVPEKDILRGIIKKDEDYICAVWIFTKDTFYTATNNGIYIAIPCNTIKKDLLSNSCVKNVQGVNQSSFAFDLYCTIAQENFPNHKPNDYPESFQIQSITLQYTVKNAICVDPFLKEIESNLKKMCNLRNN